MSSFTVRPLAAGARLSGDATVPGDKSIGHRAVLFSALAVGRSRVRGLSGGEDNQRTVAALRALGLAVTREGDTLLLDGTGLDGLRAPTASIDCGNSGTTMRLLAGVLASRPFASTLVGDQYLERRPMGRIAEPLRAMGARIEGRSGAPRTGARRGTGPGRDVEAAEPPLLPPLVVGPAPSRRPPLVGIAYDSPRASAQVKSAILLAGLAAEGATTVREPTRSRDHTERMLRWQGAPLVERADGGAHVVTLDPAGFADRDRTLRPLDLRVPGDLSSAAFLLGAGALVPGSVVTVRAVGVNPSRTGVIDALRLLGAELTVTPVGEGAGELAGEPVADLSVRGGGLRGAILDGELAVRAIDELPLLAALAAHAAGETTIRDAAELRVKESDRIAAMIAALRGMGVDCDELPDGMTIRGGRVKGGTVDSHGDHRIAMASAVCALVADGPTHIEDTDNVATSFPTFLETMARLGALIA